MDDSNQVARTGEICPVQGPVQGPVPGDGPPGGLSEVVPATPVSANPVSGICAPGEGLALPAEPVPGAVLRVLVAPSDAVLPDGRASSLEGGPPKGGSPEGGQPEEGGPREGRALAAQLAGLVTLLSTQAASADGSGGQAAGRGLDCVLAADLASALADPGGAAVLVALRAPRHQLAEAVAAGRAPSEALAGWAAMAWAVLAACRRHRRRVTLIDLDRAVADPGALAQALERRLGCALAPVPPLGPSPTPRPGPQVTVGGAVVPGRQDGPQGDDSALALVLADSVLAADPVARRLAAELEAMVLDPGGAGPQGAQAGNPGEGNPGGVDLADRAFAALQAAQAAARAARSEVEAGRGTEARAAARAEAAEAALEGVRERLDLLAAERELALDALTRTRVGLGDLEAELGRMRAARAAAEADAAEQRTARAADVQALTARLEAAEARAAAETRTLGQQIRAATEKATETAAEAAAAAKALAAATAERDALRRQLDEAEAARQAAEADRIQAEAAATAQRAAEQAAERATEQAEAQKALEQAVQAAMQEGARKAAADAEAAAAGAARQAEGAVQAARAALAEAEQTAARLRKQCHGLAHERDALTAQAERNREALARLRAQVDQHQAAAAALAGQLESAQGELGRDAAAREALQNRHDLAVAEQELLRNKLAEMQVELHWQSAVGRAAERQLAEAEARRRARERALGADLLRLARSGAAARAQDRLRDVALCRLLLRPSSERAASGSAAPTAPLPAAGWREAALAAALLRRPASAEPSAPERESERESAAAGLSRGPRIWPRRRKVKAQR